MAVQNIDLDAPKVWHEHPDLGIGDLIKWTPVLKELIGGVEAAVHARSQTIPAIKFKVDGEHVELGPIPIVVRP